MRLFKEHNLESTSTICKLRNSDTIRIITESMTGHTNEMDFTDTCDIKTKEGVKLLRNYLGQKTDITTSEESRQYRSVDIRLPIPFLKVTHKCTRTHLPAFTIILVGFFCTVNNLDESLDEEIKKYQIPFSR